MAEEKAVEGSPRIWRTLRRLGERRTSEIRAARVLSSAVAAAVRRGWRERERESPEIALATEMRDVRLTGVRVEGGEGVHESGAPQPMVMPKGSIGPVTNLNRGEVPEIRKTIKDTKPNSSVGTMNITQIGGGRPTILI